MKPRVNICWLRRDLRIEDNAALFHALKTGIPVVPVFVFDTNILEEISSGVAGEKVPDQRVEFIHSSLKDIQKQLVKLGTSFQIFHGTPVEMFRQLQKSYSIERVFTNHDYEPYARKRDGEVSAYLEETGIELNTYKDQVIFEKNEVVKDNGQPYTVYTPYSRKWKSLLNPFYQQSYPTEKYFQNFYRQEEIPVPSLESMGFKRSGKPFPYRTWEKQLISDYDKTRNFPATEGTSRLSVHLRFGTISIRELVRVAGSLNQQFLNELIWRDFYQMILWHFPKVVDQSFKPAYDKIQWRNNEAEFEAWCTGQTGYPIVDAGMRELNETGYMHNRVRMIVASFLTKHLLIDWRWGEAYFAEKLLDYDLAANNGGWQWAAGSGCDAAPYFRIFNPYLQTKKFDPDMKYIRKWVPEFEEFTYIKPIVNHEEARKRCLEVYAAAVKSPGQD